MKAYRIKDWYKLYETHDTKKLKRMTWVPIPNKHDGEGYRTIIEHERGPEIFAAWILLLQVASKCEPRGELINRGNEPITALSMSKKTGMPGDCFTLAFKVLEEINWLEIFESPGIPGDCGRLAGTNGIEGTGRELGISLSKQTPASPVFNESGSPRGTLENVIKKNFVNGKRERMLADLKAMPLLKTLTRGEEDLYCAIYVLAGVKNMRERYPDFVIYKFIQQAIRQHYKLQAIAGAIDAMLEVKKDPDNTKAYWFSLLENTAALTKTWEEKIWPEVKNETLEL